MDEHKSQVSNQQQPTRSRQPPRLTDAQIQEMEELFKVCQHPENRQKQELSTKLGLPLHRIRYWFKNRRAQMKAFNERTEIVNLRAENEMLRSENRTLKEALENFQSICQTFGGPVLLGEFPWNEYVQHLTVENSRLKEEIKRVLGIVSQSTGRSMEEVEAMESSPILEMRKPMNRISHSVGISCDVDKTWALEAAMNAVVEVIQMARGMDVPHSSTTPTNDNFSSHGCPRSSPSALHLKHKDKFNTEATTVVMMAGVILVEAFMDVNKWMEMFPGIVTTAKTLQILSPGLSPPNKSGLLQLMHAELQVPSPLGSIREIHFFRYCHQLTEGAWAVVDFSHHSSTLHSKYLSGRIIQQLPNGQSKITWVEYSETQGDGTDKALGAQRWVAALERQCQRLVVLNSTQLGDQGRAIMKLAQRIINCFYQDISASKFHSSATQFHDSVKITTRMSNIHKGLIICATTSLWLPVSPQRLFDFLRDEQMRSKWEVSLEGKPMQQIKHIAIGPHPGNCISLYCVTASNMETFILQESCTDTCGSLIVYSPLDVEAIIRGMRGEDPSSPALLPSVFTILPEDSAANTASSSTSVLDRSRSEGSSLQATFQVVCSDCLEESQQRMSNFVCNTVQRIKAAFYYEYKC